MPQLTGIQTGRSPITYNTLLYIGFINLLEKNINLRSLILILYINQMTGISSYHTIIRRNTNQSDLLYNVVMHHRNIAT